MYMIVVSQFLNVKILKKINVYNLISFSLLQFCNIYFENYIYKHIFSNIHTFPTILIVNIL